MFHLDSLENMPSGLDSNHASNNSLAVDFPFIPSFAIRVTAKGIYPKAVSKQPTFGLSFELGLISWKIQRQASSSIGSIYFNYHLIPLLHGGHAPCIVTRIEMWHNLVS